MKEWMRTRKKRIGIIVCALFLGSSFYLYSTNESEPELLPVTAASASAKGAKEERASTPDQKPLQNTESSLPAAPATVDVKGAVIRPGVYTMSPGSRVHEAIQQAGGLAPEADSRSLNGAKKIVDGMLIYVPRQGETPPVTGGENGTAGTDNGKVIVNINEATSEQLQTIPGIGPAKAVAILEYREKKGAFKKVEDITNVSGIGPKTLEKIRSRLTVE
ncbi:competence protein ComEA [Aneurinibacillus soli]|uniref:ComE operon protein 1 n=1 Tax=Aneurinibacillus soli TaxID=1500254 RepID=A0A0U5AY29_9BACL|nr:helix-hairpin-helix domain-containing protein [Aneurinibacillus soli]PYE62592.1 competence protein ComEA [Aneurinibacillus soli]BAU27154.1 ComE operon protein 1 [Aneurinibacillus soli]